jgi:hypothetical protein
MEALMNQKPELAEACVATYEVQELAVPTAITNSISF